MRITSGDEAGRVIEIHDELIVGRSREGEGRIPDPEISRTHARVYVESDGGLAIEDLGSTNGVFVGGIRITAPRALSPGDTLRMGQTTLEVEAAPAAEPEPAAPPVGEPAAPPAAAPPRAAADATTVAAPPTAAPPRQQVPRLLVAVLAGVFVLAALGIGAVVIFTGDDEKEEKEAPAAPSAQVEGPPALVRAATAAGCTAQDHEPEGRGHVTGTIRYRTNPPNSGNHSVEPAEDGAWEVSPPVPSIVHSLEHGRIVMWHKPKDAAGERMLRAVGDEDGSKMLLVPNTTDMPFRVAATAWGHVLGCRELNPKVPDAVRAFRDAYRGKGPELVP